MVEVKGSGCKNLIFAHQYCEKDTWISDILQNRIRILLFRIGKGKTIFCMKKSSWVPDSISTKDYGSRMPVNNIKINNSDSSLNLIEQFSFMNFPNLLFYLRKSTKKNTNYFYICKPQDNSNLILVRRWLNKEKTNQLKEWMIEENTESVPPSKGVMSNFEFFSKHLSIDLVRISIICSHINGITIITIN